MVEFIYVFETKLWIQMGMLFKEKLLVMGMNSLEVSLFEILRQNR